MTSIQKIVKGIGDKTGEDLGARIVYEGLPSTEPPYIPAVIVEWENTTVNGNNYATQQNKRLIANANVRIHQGSLLWLYSASSNAIVETAKAYEEGQKLLDVFMRDIRLEDASGEKLADKVSITRIEPVETQWGQTIYFGVRAEWEAQELL